ncbi:MAG: hypothetical protein KC777_00795 [Cyanobacteria bacterium HKST-UBA02]|nr:hypothetical protein [Cyanobacteria bacterium HKST-UBA02]
MYLALAMLACCLFPGQSSAIEPGYYRARGAAAEEILNLFQCYPVIECNVLWRNEFSVTEKQGKEYKRIFEGTKAELAAFLKTRSDREVFFASIGPGCSRPELRKFLGQLIEMASDLGYERKVVLGPHSMTLFVLFDSDEPDCQILDKKELLGKEVTLKGTIYTDDDKDGPYLITSRSFEPVYLRNLSAKVVVADSSKNQITGILEFDQAKRQYYLDAERARILPLEN